MAASAVPPAAGFTLVELAVVCAMVGVLAAVALPSYQNQLLRSGRADGVDALTRLQLAQAQHHAAHGMYATELSALRGVPQPDSSQGLYQLAVAGGGDGYRATAAAQGRQRKDSECSVLSVEVARGFTHLGPSARCWNR
jgi:type IV pilus assembly protein PilE